MDVATTSINNLSQAVNLLTRASSRLDEQVFNFKKFLEEHKKEVDASEEELYGKYKALFDQKNKGNKESDKNLAKEIFTSFSKSSLFTASTKKPETNENSKGLMTALSNMGRSSIIMKDALAAGFNTLRTSLKDDKSTVANSVKSGYAALQAVLVSGFDNLAAKNAAPPVEKDEPKVKEFETEAEIEAKNHITVSSFSESALSQLKGLFTQSQKDGNGKAAGGGNSKMANVLALALGLGAMTAALMAMAEIPVASIVKLGVVIGMLGLAIWGLDKVAGKAMLSLSVSLGIMSLALVGVVFSMKMLADVPWTDIMAGIVVIGGLTMALMAMAPMAAGVLTTSYALGVAAISFIVIAKALQMLADVSFEDLLIGVVAISSVTLALAALSSLTGPVLVAAAALGVASLAFMGIAKALQMLGSVDSAAVAKLGETILGFMVGLGKLVFILPAVALGIPVLMGVGAALGVFGAGLSVLAVGMNILAPTLPTLSAFLTQISSVNPSALLSLAPGIIAFAGALGVLSVAMLAFSAANLVSGVLGSIGSFFDNIVPDKQVDKIKEAVSALEKLQSMKSSVDLGPISTSIDKLVSSLAKVEVKAAVKLKDSLEALGNVSGDVLGPITKLSLISLNKATDEMSKMADASSKLAPALLSVANINLSGTISQLRTLVDTINDVSLLKVGALATIMSNQKPIEMNVKEKTTQKETVVAQDGTKSVTDAINTLRSSSDEGVNALLDKLTILIEAVKAKETASPVNNTVVSSVVSGGGSSGASSPTISPYGASTKELARAPFSINGRPS